MLADVPRGTSAKLHTFDDMGRARPKKMHYKRVKSVVNAAYYQPTAGFTKPLTAGYKENTLDIPNNCESVLTDSLQSSILYPLGLDGFVYSRPKT